MGHSSNMVHKVIHTVMLVVMAFFMTLPGHAQNTTPGLPESCDQSVYDLMKAQAYLEGKREMEMAQRLILKPDSTLEYSCFAQTAYIEWAYKAGSFSEMTNGKLPQNSLDLAIAGVIQGTLDPYLQGNFGHKYLGNTFVDSMVGQTSTCNPMFWVWHVAKCTNTKNFHFFNLRDLLTQDYREFPLPCESGYSGSITAQMCRTGNFGNMTERQRTIATAQCALNSFPDGPSNRGVDDATHIAPNETETYAQRLQTCGRPIPVGRWTNFYRAGGGAPIVVSDHVCIAPGCSYDGGCRGENPPANCGSCVRNGLSPL